MRYKKEKLFSLQSTYSLTVLKFSGIYIPTSLISAVITIINALYSPDSTTTLVTTLSFASIINGLSTFFMIILMFVAYLEAPVPTDRKGPQFILASAFVVRASGIATSLFLQFVAKSMVDAESTYQAGISQIGNTILTVMEIGGLFMLALVSVRVFKGALFVALGGASVAMPLMFQQARELITLFESLTALDIKGLFNAFKANINTTSIILLFLFTVLYFMETVKQERKKKKAKK